LHLVVPESVMRLGPFFVDLAVSHRIIGAGRAPSADVDVTHGGRHIQCRGAYVQIVGKLGDISRKAEVAVENVREVKYQARNRHDQAEEYDAAPEPDLFTGIEETCRHMFVADHAATFFKP